MTSRATVPPPVSTDYVPVLPTEIVSKLETESCEQEVPFDVAYPAYKNFLKIFEGLSNARIVTSLEGFVAPPMFSDRGDMVVTGKIHMFFGSTAEKLITENRHAWRVLVVLSGLDFAVYISRLTQWGPANALIAQINEVVQHRAQDMRPHFQPIETLMNELEPKEQANYLRIKPDVTFSLKELELEHVTPPVIITELLAGVTAPARDVWIFWRIVGENSEAQIRLWLMKSQPSAKDKAAAMVLAEKILAPMEVQPVKPEPPVAAAVAPPAPVVVTAPAPVAPKQIATTGLAMLLNKRARPNDM
jgi:hypothetical protein